MQAGATYTGAPLSPQRMIQTNSPLNESRLPTAAQKLRILTQQSPKGIKDMSDSRVHFILKAKERREDRRSEVFKPALTGIRKLESVIDDTKFDEI